MCIFFLFSWRQERHCKYNFKTPWHTLPMAGLQLTVLLTPWFLSPSYSFGIVSSFPNFFFFLNQDPFSFLFARTSRNLQVSTASSIIYSNDSSLPTRERTTKACFHSTLAFDNLVTLKSVASNGLTREKCFPTSVSNYITCILYFYCP